MKLFEGSLKDLYGNDEYHSVRVTVPSLINSYIRPLVEIVEWCKHRQSDGQYYYRYCTIDEVRGRDFDDILEFLFDDEYDAIDFALRWA